MKQYLIILLVFFLCMVAGRVFAYVDLTGATAVHTYTRNLNSTMQRPVVKPDFAWVAEMPDGKVFLAFDTDIVMPEDGHFWKATHPTEGYLGWKTAENIAERTVYLQDDWTESVGNDVHFHHFSMMVQPRLTLGGGISFYSDLPLINVSRTFGAGGVVNVYQYKPSNWVAPYFFSDYTKAYTEPAVQYEYYTTTVQNVTIYCDICGVSIPPHYEVSANLSDRSIWNDSSVYPMAYRVVLRRAGGDHYATLESGIMDPDPFAAGSAVGGIRQGHPLSDYGMIPFCLIPKVETWLIPAGLSSAGLDMGDPEQWSPGVAGDYDYSVMDLPSAELDVTSNLESSGNVVYAGAEDYSDFADMVAALEGTTDYQPYYPDGQTISWENLSASDNPELQTDIDNQAGIPDAYKDDGLRDTPPPPEGLSAADMAGAVRAGTAGGFGAVVNGLSGVQNSIDGMIFDTGDLEVINASGFGDVVAGLSGVQSAVDAIEPSVMPTEIAVEPLAVPQEAEHDSLDEITEVATNKAAAMIDDASYSIELSGEIVTIWKRDLDSVVPAITAFGNLLESYQTSYEKWTMVPADGVTIGDYSFPSQAITWDLKAGFFEKARIILRALNSVMWFSILMVLVFRMFNYWVFVSKA